MKLRDYQIKIIDDVRESMRLGRKSQLIVSPTGSGKTTIFSAFTHLAIKKNSRVLILAHRQELLDQITESLNNFGIHFPKKLCAKLVSEPMPTQVCVGSVFLAAKYDLPAFDIVIVDEAHHCIASNTWGRAIKNSKARFILGVTATPLRLSGEPLGEIFEDMILGPSTKQLIDQGYLSPYKAYAAFKPNLTGVRSCHGDWGTSSLAHAMDKPHITGSAITEYKRHCMGMRAVVFCVSIEHAHSVRRDFENAGISTGHVDGKLSSLERKTTIEKFKRNEIQVLTSVDLISEGFDLPAIQAAILLRPTQSICLYLQQVGRALRPHPDKTHAIILDHAGNIERHGLPCEDREWSLSSRITPKTNKSKPTLSVKICPQCFFAIKSGPTSCPNCGLTFPVESRQITEVEGDLKEINITERRSRRREQGMAQTKQELVEIAKARGYKRPHAWAHFIWQSRQRRRLQK